MKTLKKFEFRTSGSFESKHNWDKLLDGGIYQLNKGEDYDCEDQTMRMMAYKQAHKRGKAIKVQVVEGGLVIQAEDATPEQIEAWKQKEEAAKARRKAAKEAARAEAEEEVAKAGS